MHLADYKGPEIDTIQVFALEPLTIDDLQHNGLGEADVLHTGSHWRFRIVRQALCDETQAGSVSRFWNALASGEVARCHLPGFALQFRVRNDIAFTAALCWQCNTISYAGFHAPTHRVSFDA